MHNIEQIAHKLKLPNLKVNHEILIQKAESEKMPYSDFLKLILKDELEQRQINSINKKISSAKFPMKKYLDDYDLTNYKIEVSNKISRLKTLEFIDNNENVLLFGNPGVGKTHLAIALGVKACLENKTVLFISVPNLIIELKEAMSMNQINNYKKKFAKFDLVILDELGYISFDKDGSEILFNLLSTRNDAGSMIITTNLMFDRWEEIFIDPILTGAMVDRLAHKAHVMDLSGNSYRIQETKNWLQV